MRWGEDEIDSSDGRAPFPTAICRPKCRTLPPPDPTFCACPTRTSREAIAEHQGCAAQAAAMSGVQTERPCARTSCARCAFTRRYTRHAEGSVLVEFGDTRVLCTASVEERVPPFLQGQGPAAGSRPSTACCRAPPTRASTREAARGKQIGPHAGDPAPDRPLAARGRRPARARRAHDHARLRRAAGRRRHAHRGDHRRASWRCRCARAGCGAQGARARARCTDYVAAVSVGISRGRRCSTSTTPRTPRARPT